MKKTIFSTVIMLGLCVLSLAQSTPTTTPVPQRGTTPQRPSPSFELTTYGVSFDIEPRVLVMMAALEAAGFEATPAGTTPSDFRAQVRKDLANLDPDLRARLRTFYERNKLPAPATPADQAARYISLALALGPPPLLEAPERSDQLPGSLLEVLDFAPLVREFYRRSDMDEKLDAYTRAYQAEGDRLRQPTANMVQSVLSYLHTRPTTVWTERILVKAPSTQKKSEQRYTTRQHDRHFFVVPDLLGVPGAINFRVIGEDYYAVVPEGTNPILSELRRGYFQYVIDPLVLKFNRQIADRREQIRRVLAAREKAGATVSPDVFLSVSRSLVAAADARFDESRKIALVMSEARAKLANTKDDAARRAIVKESQTASAALQDQSIARLADDYERGAVLAFFFAEQLKEIESSGFDIANFLPDMIASFDPARETNRLTEVAEARKRALAARQARIAARSAEGDPPVYSEADASRAAALVKQLGEIEKILQAKDYPAAETRLKELLKDYSREPRIFFALAQTSSVAAADATNEEVQARRLQAALTNYRLAVEAASPETDRALISRAHVAMGRIYAFLDQNVDAANEFDEAIKIGEVTGGAYREAVEGRNKLPPPKGQSAKGQALRARR
ncbi:MAG: tol-pal system YbgF family protein [Pyrinomonadaceae bacterium]